MRTNMECRSLGEEKSNYTTNSSVKQIKQKDTNSTSYKSSSKGGGGKLAVGLLAGAGVGVLAGLLLAPEKGKDLRKQMSNSATKLGGQVSKTFNSTKTKVSGWTGKGANADAKNLGAEVVGKVKKSPYTDENKWDDQENKNMINTAKNTPGI